MHRFYCIIDLFKLSPYIKAGYGSYAVYSRGLDRRQKIDNIHDGAGIEYHFTPQSTLSADASGAIYSNDFALFVYSIRYQHHFKLRQYRPSWV